MLIWSFFWRRIPPRVSSKRQPTLGATASGTLLHSESYSDYDSYGNLKLKNTSYRSTLAGGLTSSQESYTYDNLHRLTVDSIGGVAGAPTVTYSYDAVGNFQSKADYASSYSYAPTSNRLQSVQLAGGGQKTFGYDASGNLTQENGVTTIDYNAFNKPTVIRRPNVLGMAQSTEFDYGADLMRYRKVTQAGTETLYINKLYEQITDGNTVKERYYIEDIAALTVTTIGTTATSEIAYTHKDRLGSTVALVDHDGGDPLEFHSFDPFGKPRQGSGAAKSAVELASGYMTRGFTDHEHLDEIQLIHMNGRGYDYNLGRFLSVDPFIVEPENSQALNPYAYVLNNPLSGVDPTGYCTAATGTRVTSCKDVKVTAISSETGKSASTTVNVNTKNGADVQSKVGGAIAQTTAAAGVENIGSAVHIGSNGARTNLMPSVGGCCSSGDAIDTGGQQTRESQQSKSSPRNVSEGSYRRYDARRVDAWNVKNVKGIRLSAEAEGSPYEGVVDEGEWKPYKLDSVDLTDFIPAKRAVWLIKLMTLTTEEARLVEYGQFQNYNVYRYNVVFDLVNGDVKNLGYEYGSRTLIDNISELIRNTSRYEVETRTCWLGSVGC